MDPDSYSSHLCMPSFLSSTRVCTRTRSDMADTVSSTRNRKPSRKRAANDVAIADRDLKKKKKPSKRSRHAAASAAEVVTIEESEDENNEHDEDDENGEGEDSEDDEYPPLPNPDENWNDHSWNRDVVSRLVAASPRIITLIPRSGKKRYTVHKEALCFYSPYYRSLLSGRWEDGKKDEFDADTTSAALGLFIRWLYTGTVGIGTADAEWEELTDLYIFANVRLILALRRDIMNMYVDNATLKEGSVWFHEYRDIAKVYEHLPGSSPLRLRIISSYIHHYTPDVDDEEQKKQRALITPVDFLFEVVEGQARLHKEGAYSMNRYACPCCHRHCAFHEHKSKEERTATCPKKPQRP